MPHAVLPGDSIFDYGAYVGSGVPVIQQVRARLAAEWRATLLARDGAVITGVLAQIQQLLAGASHLVFSVGGNDAIRYRHIRSSPASVSSVVLREIVSPVEPAETGGAEIAELLQKNSVQPRFFTREDGSFSVRGHCRAEVTGRLLFVSAGQGLSGGGIYAEFFQADPDRRQ